MMTVTKKTIVGVDWSLNCPAACVLAEDGSFEKSKFLFLTRRKRDEDVRHTNIECRLLPEYQSEEERYDVQTTMMAQFIWNSGPNKIVFLEGYAMGARGLVFNIAECTGLLKHKLWELHVPFHLVAPPTVKKFATGKGNSDKEAMYKAFRMQGNPDLMKFYGPKAGSGKIGSPVTDIVDSYYLARYGMEIGIPSATVPTEQREQHSPAIPLIMKAKKVVK